MVIPVGVETQTFMEVTKDAAGKIVRKPLFGVQSAAQGRALPQTPETPSKTQETQPRFGVQSARCMDDSL